MLFGTTICTVVIRWWYLVPACISCVHTSAINHDSWPPFLYSKCILIPPKKKLMWKMNAWLYLSMIQTTLTEPVFWKNVFDICFEVLVWPLSNLITLTRRSWWFMVKPATRDFTLGLLSCPSLFSVSNNMNAYSLSMVEYLHHWWQSSPMQGGENSFCSSRMLPNVDTSNTVVSA